MFPARYGTSKNFRVNITISKRQIMNHVKLILRPLVRLITSSDGGLLALSGPLNCVRIVLLSRRVQNE
jgi:hypothetical protein